MSRKNGHGKENQAQLFISNINSVRDLIRHLYLYGCLPQSDFYGTKRVSDYQEGRAHPSSSAFNVNMKRYSFYIPEYHRSVNGKYHKIRFERFSPHTRNDGSMIRIFKYGSYNANAMAIYFLVLPMLGKDFILEDTLYNKIERTVHQLDGLSSKTVHKYLVLMEKEGFIERNADAGEVRWRLSLNLLDQLNEQQLADLYRMLMFFSETSVLKTPFYLAACRVNLYMMVNKTTANPVENQIIYKQDYVFDVLDDEQMYQLLYAIHEKNSVRISFLKQVRYDHRDPGHIEEHLVIPVRIIADDHTGRKSLLMYDCDAQAADIVRLNRIYLVEKQDKLTDEQLLTARQKTDAYKDVWVASNDLSGEKEVRVRFWFEGEMGKEESRRLEDELEKRNGKLEGNVFAANVTDPHEMVTWIRGFGDYAEPLTEELRDLIREDWHNVLAKMDGRKAQIESPVMNPPELSSVNNMKEQEITLFRQSQNVRFDIFTWCINKCIRYRKVMTAAEITEDAAEYFASRNTEQAKTLVKGKYPMQKEGDAYRPYTEEPVPVLLSSLEKEAIANALKDPRCRYFLNERTYKKMTGLFSNIEPRWSFDAVEHKNISREEDGTYDYADNVAKLRHAIETGQAVRYDYAGRGNHMLFHNQLMYPRYFEYTANGRLRLIAWCPVAGTFLRNTISRITNLMIDREAKKVNLNALWEEYLRTNQRKAVLELEPNEFALERMVRLFSCYEREMVYKGQDRKPVMTVKYMADERLDIMRDILSCGDYCKVIKPDELAAGIYERVSRALKLLEKK